MNIKEEVKLFEKHAQKFFTTNDAFSKECDNYIYDEVKFMWDCWITAKQQAVPKYHMQNIRDALVIACDMREDEQRFEDSLNFIHDSMI